MSRRPKIAQCPSCGHKRTTKAGGGMVLKCPQCEVRYRIPGGHKDAPDAILLGTVSPSNPAPPPPGGGGAIPEALPPAPDEGTSPEPDPATSPETSRDVPGTSPPPAADPAQERAKIKGRLGGMAAYRR